MESVAAVELWSTSVEKRGLKYTEYIDDGDCKGHSNVVASLPYGPDVEVVKCECWACPEAYGTSFAGASEEAGVKQAE